MCPLGWIRIMNKAVMHLKNACDSSVALQQCLGSEMSAKLCLENSTQACFLTSQRNGKYFLHHLVQLVSF